MFRVRGGVLFVCLDEREVWVDVLCCGDCVLGGGCVVLSFRSRRCRSRSERRGCVRRWCVCWNVQREGDMGLMFDGTGAGTCSDVSALLCVARLCVCASCTVLMSGRVCIDVRVVCGLCIVVLLLWKSRNSM